MAPKDLVKALVGERGRGVVRRFGRVRWITKSRKARACGWTPRTHPRGWLREVVVSPEVDTYTYDTGNRDELARVLARHLGASVAAVVAALDEAATDPELHARLARDVSWRVLWLKRRPGLSAHHLTMWTAVRLLRPGLVVETGVLEGLGSRVVLRALERNAAEGHPGRLVSFDVMATSGVLVPERLRGRWTRVIESTTTGLDGHLGDARVDLFLHDSLPTAEHQRFELDWALEHGARLAVTTHGWSDVPAALAAARGLRSEVFDERPLAHFFPGRQVGLVSRPGAGAA